MPPGKSAPTTKASAGISNQSRPVSAQESIKPSDLQIMPPVASEVAPEIIDPSPTQPPSPSHSPNWRSGLKHILLVSLLFVLGLTLFSGAVLIAGHRFIIDQWPRTQAFYIKLGFAEDPLKDNLVLQNITSERRYIDGAMQLFVNGEVHSQAKKRQVIPTIFVEGLGPDGRLIESWRIPAPAATIDSGSTIPFSASFLSPEGTVVEVNLSFVEQTQ